MIRNRNLRCCLLSLLASMLFIACESDYLPERHPSLSEQDYNKALSTLKKAYELDNDFVAAVQLSILKAEPATVYDLLDKGLRKSPELCQKLYSANYLYEQTGQKTSIVAVDPARFHNIMELCSGLNGAEDYQNFKKKQSQAQENMKAQRLPLDTTQFNNKLIAQLQDIRSNNDNLRAQQRSAEREGQLTATLLDKIYESDTKNLKEIMKIVDEHGYPSEQLVGYDISGIVFQVLNLQKNVSLRDKYATLIRDNVNSAMMSFYDSRSKELTEVNSDSN